MSDQKTLQTFYKHVLVFTAACLTAAAFFYFLYLHDNKYTLRAPTAQDGTVLLDACFPPFSGSSGSELSENRGSAVSLADGWEFYPGQLLTAEEIGSGVCEPIRTYAGRYLNLSSFNKDRSPYGDAAYLLRLHCGNSAEMGSPVTLYLPEVYSACQVFVQGRLAASSGSLTPYRPLIRDLFVTFELEEDITLLIRTSNYSHYYSGMIFPPVLGTADSIGRLIGFRMIFYGFLCFTSLAVALFSAAVWAGTRRRRDLLSLLFAALALSFAVRVCYPFLRLFGVPLIRPLYALEDGAAMVGIWCALRIAFTLCKIPENSRTRPVSRFALAMIAFAVLFPHLVLPYFPLWTGFYGAAITWYKLLTGLLLICAVLFGNAGKGQLFLAAGTGFYGSALAAGALSVSRFEPLRAGWFEEYGSFSLVLTFAVLMVMRSRTLVRDNERLTAHLSEEVERQTSQICGLVDERQRLLSEFLHDLKSPAAAIVSYAELVKENQILLDNTLRSQLDTIEIKSRSLSRQVLAMQQFTLENPLTLRREPLELRSFLSDFHRMLKPDVELSGPDFNLLLPDQDCFIPGDADQLHRVFQNLVYNACDFTPPEGSVTLSLERGTGSRTGQAVIRVADTGCGISKEDLEHLFDRFYTTRRKEGGQGLGLYVVRTIVSGHGGTVEAESVPGVGSVFTVCLPLTEESSGPASP